jgi:hypothetical protein
MLIEKKASYHEKRKQLARIVKNANRRICLTWHEKRKQTYLFDLAMLSKSQPSLATGWCIQKPQYKVFTARQ